VWQVNEDVRAAYDELKVATLGKPAPLKAKVVAKRGSRAVPR
jgi:hypothetical protein